MEWNACLQVLFWYKNVFETTSKIQIRSVDLDNITTMLMSYFYNYTVIT